MRFRKSLAMLGIVCLGLVATRPAQAADEAAKPVVKLVDAGNGPKQKLRYHFQKGAAETLNMDMEMSMKMSMGGQQVMATDLPVMKMTMKVQITEVMDNGDAKMAMEFTDGDVGEKAGVPAQVTEQMKASMKKMVGMKGTGTISSRGEAKEAKFEAPPNADPQVQQSLQSAEQQLSQMAAPLPEEEVGVGAKWDVTMEVKANGVNVAQTISYTLKELNGNNATMDIAIKQSAPKQMVQGMQLDKMESTGTGTGKLDLTKLVPVDYHANLDMNMVMVQGDNKMDMAMKMNIVMKPGH